jgi:hypothetical protein
MVDVDGCVQLVGVKSKDRKAQTCKDAEQGC